MTLAEGAVSVERAAKVLSPKRSAAYAAVQRGEIPVLRYGRKLIRVPTSYLRAALEPQASAASRPASVLEAA